MLREKNWITMKWIRTWVSHTFMAEWSANCVSDNSSPRLSLEACSMWKPANCHTILHQLPYWFWSKTENLSFLGWFKRQSLGKVSYSDISQNAGNHISKEFVNIPGAACPYISPYSKKNINAVKLSSLQLTHVWCTEYKCKVSKDY